MHPAGEGNPRGDLKLICDTLGWPPKAGKDHDITSELRDKIVRLCTANPGDEKCVKVHDLCLSKGKGSWGNTRTVCERLGWLGGGGGADRKDPFGSTTAFGFLYGKVLEPRPGRFNGVEQTYGGHINSRVIGVNSVAAAALDVSLSGGGGFWYDASLAVGPGKWFGQKAGVALVGGIGVSGSTRGNLPFALHFPVEACAILFAAARLSLTVYGRVRWLAMTETLWPKGSASASFADEFQAGANLTFAKRTPAWQSESETGFVVGAQFTEQADSRIIGLVIGFGAAKDPVARPERRRSRAELRPSCVRVASELRPNCVASELRPNCVRIASELRPNCW